MEAHLHLEAIAPVDATDLHTSGETYYTLTMQRSGTWHRMTSRVIALFSKLTAEICRLAAARLNHHSHCKQRAVTLVVWFVAIQGCPCQALVSGAGGGSGWSATMPMRICIAVLYQASVYVESY